MLFEEYLEFCSSKNTAKTRCDKDCPYKAEKSDVMGTPYCWLYKQELFPDPNKFGFLKLAECLGKEIPKSATHD